VRGFLATAFNLFFLVEFFVSAISTIFIPGRGKVMMISCGFEKKREKRKKLNKFKLASDLTEGNDSWSWTHFGIL